MSIRWREGSGRFAERDTTTVTPTNAHQGTPAFRAPEQSTPGGAKEADHRTDVFALGRTLYFLLTSELPYHPEISKLPAGIRFIYSRATKISKDDRYQSVADLLAVVRKYRDATDPKKNIRIAFDAARSDADRLHRVKHYDADLLAHLMDLAGGLLEKDFVSGLQAFDSIDNEILMNAGKMAEEATTGALAKYVDAIERRANDGNYGRDWGYADKVGKKANVLWRKEISLEIRIHALEALLICAGYHNQFTALDVFRELICLVEEGEALPVSEMLRRRIKYLAVVADKPLGPNVPELIEEVRKEASELRRFKK